jgi:hypothetical protein
MRLHASDGRGGTMDVAFLFEIVPNAGPVIVRPNDLLLVSAGAFVDHDVSQGGTTAADAEGDPMTYGVQLSADRHGLSVTGQRITGVFSGEGAVRATVTASDPFGASVSEVFIIAAPAPLPGAPSLPQVSYVYDDLQLPMPDVWASFRSGIPRRFPIRQPMPAPHSGAYSSTTSVFLRPIRTPAARAMSSRTGLPMLRASPLEPRGRRVAATPWV